MSQSHFEGSGVANAFAKRLVYCATEISFEKHISILFDVESVAGWANKLYSQDFVAIFELKIF